MKKMRILFGGGIIFVSAVVLFLTHDIIITHFLALQICRGDPQPKTFIKKSVEYPESIYWEDNVYPGFDENDRLLMIRNYLDGVHLKTMALNGPDGKIYVYTATEEDWRESREIHARKRTGDYFKTLELESRRIAGRGKVYTRGTMPRFNYSVVFNPVSLTPFERRYLWSDEVTITDKKTDEIIAYNRRLMRRWYMILPDFGMGHRYYSPKPMCGLSDYTGFDDRVFPIDRINGMNHLQFINNKLYQKIKEK
jgi:hypothetical protein